jgi:hypothetical protein
MLFYTFLLQIHKTHHITHYAHYVTYFKLRNVNITANASILFKLFNATRGSSDIVPEPQRVYAASVNISQRQSYIDCHWRLNDALGVLKVFVLLPSNANG